MTKSERAIRDCEAELAEARQWAAQGRKEVSAAVAGPNARGRRAVPLEEYIRSWEERIEALRGGADPELYEY